MNVRGWWIFLVKEILGYYRESPVSPWDIEQRELATQRIDEIERADNLIIASTKGIFLPNSKRKKK